MTNTTSTTRGRTVKLLIAGAGALAVLGAGATAAEAAPRPAVPSGTTAAITATPTPTTATTAISSRQAVVIATKRVPGARVTKVEHESEHGQRVWKVVLKKNGTEYRVYVSAKTGKIIKVSTKHGDKSRTRHG
ncbi:PepSY domain-containing protein [Sphaerisporangium sp. NPDC051017]|uniref:PepSY domain-containing protein n=1 Tax=unclassified Sphaerisporangium TaxID=2630420 RepID=UPI0033DE682A